MTANISHHPELGDDSMFYSHVSFTLELQSAAKNDFKLGTRDSSSYYGNNSYWIFSKGHLTEAGYGTYISAFDQSFYDKEGYLTRNLAGDFNHITFSDYGRDGSYSTYFTRQSEVVYSTYVGADGSGSETSYYPYETPPESFTTIYAPGTFSVTPQTAHAAVINTATYRLDSTSKVVSLHLPEDNGGFLDVRFDYSGSKAAERHLLTDATGKLIEETRYDLSGNLYFELDFNFDGSRTTSNYKNGYFLPSDDNTVFTDGSSLAHEYGVRGNITSTTSVAVDGTKIKSFDASDGLHTNTYKNGALALAEIIRLDGSKTAIASQKGITVTDTDGNDLFTSFGQDTFVFNGGGKDTIRNFHATGNLSDLIKLVDVDPSNFSIASHGQDTIIHVNEIDSITLVSVKITEVLDNILFA